MDSSRSHDPRVYAAAQRTSHVPSPPARDPYPYAKPQPTEPYGQPVGQQPRPSAHPQPWEQQPQPPQWRQPAVTTTRNAAPRRLLGMVAFAVMTVVTLPVHVLAVFFVFVEFESPGDPVTAVLLVSGAFVASFVALLLTGIVSQAVGGFPGRWRARITFAALSGVIALGLAYLGAIVYF